MTADAKVGLLLGLVFIVIIAFLINGLPKVLERGTMETLNSPVIQESGDDSLVLPSEVARVLDPALHPAPEQVAPRRTEPPETERVILDGGQPVAADQNRGPSPTEAPTAPAANKRPQSYTVRSGQNLSVIAKEIYGEVLGNKWATVQKLYAANKDRMDSMDDVKAGQVLVVPSLEEAFVPVKADTAAPAANPAPGLFERLLGIGKNPEPKPDEPAVRTYRVQENDTLWDIAETKLGNGSRYRELLQLNPDIKNPNQVPAGKEIRLPAR